MKILLSAYACEPGGSEPQIAWATALALAKRHEVWVVTRANNRATHELEFQKHPKPENLVFVYYDPPSFLRVFKRPGRFLLYYYLWQVGSARVIHRLVRNHHFDVGHHLTGGFDFLPSGLAFARLPFVWGPVGSEDTDPAILRSMPRGDRLKERRRVALRWIGRYLDPLTRLTARRASRILLHTSLKARRRTRYLRRYDPKTETAPQTGIVLDDQYHLESRAPELQPPRFRVLHAARLIHWKGARYVASGFARLARQHEHVELVVVGTGPVQGDMESAFRGEGVQDRVSFAGWLPLDQLLEVMRTSDVFLYPSYHHGLATVCLQAMAMELPVICFAGDGIEEAVGTDSGIVIDPTESQGLDESIAGALEELCDDPQRRSEMGRAAREKVRVGYSYEEMARSYERIYRELAISGPGG